MKILIVEDETAAYENLLDILLKIDSEIEVIGNTESIEQTVSWLQNNTLPDLILLDIRLSDGSAFSIFDIIEVEIPVIFITAFDEFAIEAFKVNSIDYLLKPVKEEDLIRALNKFSKRSQADTNRYMEKIAKLVPTSTYRDKFLIPSNERLIPVNVHEISCFYTTDKKTVIYLNNSTNYSYSKSLDQISLTLNPSDFFRANKQFIISRESVKNITIWFDSRLLISLNVEVPERIYISKNKAAEFKSWVVNEL
ncbi:MAG: LytTR family DNA-binding domain-containing protein [Ferruginibacter sp.]